MEGPDLARRHHIQGHNRGNNHRSSALLKVTETPATLCTATTVPVRGKHEHGLVEDNVRGVMLAHCLSPFVNSQRIFIKPVLSEVT